MKKVFATVIFALCCAPRTWANPSSWCSSSEDELFACSIGKKIVSICASKDLSRNSGYVQYRYGRANSTPELEYPSEKQHPSKTFSYGFMGSAKFSLENLQFSVSDNSYTIYREVAAFDDEGSGVLVKAHNGSAVRLKCNEASPSSKLDFLGEDGLRSLPEESLVSFDSLGTWPAESPDADLLQGVQTHNFALTDWALNHGADVNYHGALDAGVLGFLADNRFEAMRQNRVVAFDDETDRLLTLLLAYGASPALTANGATAIDFLESSGAPDPVLRRVLDAGWRTDYAYRLYAGLLLGDSDLVAEALNHGVDPNGTIRGARYLTEALLGPCKHSWQGDEAAQRPALAVLKQLLDAGAKIQQGDKFAGGDITGVYANSGAQPNIRPVLDLLIRYATDEDKRNTTAFLMMGPAGNPKRQANYDWLLKRLKE